MAGLPVGSASMKAGAFGVADQCLVSLANLAVGLAAARVMAPADFGVYVIAFAVSLAGGSVQQSLITDPLVILGAPRAGAGLAAYVSSLLRVQILCALLVSLVVGAVAGTLHLAWGATSSIPAALLAVAAATLPVQLQGFLRALYFTRLQPASVLVNDIVYAALRLGAVGALVATDRLTTVSALLAAGAAAAAAFLIGAPGCREHLLASPERLERTWSAHWSYGRWLLATAGAYWCSGQAPALMAGGLLTPVASAILKACQFLVSPLYVVFAGLDGVLAPRAARLAASSGASALARFLRVFALCAAGGVVLYAVVLLPAAPWLMDVVYKGRYVEYSAIVGVLLLDALLTALSRAPVLGLKVSGDTRHIFHANLCSAAAGLTAMLVLAPRLGVFGAALAAPVSSLALFVFLLLQAPRAAQPAVSIAVTGP